MKRIVTREQSYTTKLSKETGLDLPYDFVECKKSITIEKKIFARDS